ncbi:ATP-binding protein [Flaviramulus sp. BrNp1-15]|uniref:AlbA family DNA-binding domain-containing protein n=1 Tax=Flaviramulus sp. BrNp1-15 TaxID=2916754 RepID=UPI001EE845C5|nr:ATP-binding protein [Flaviramulus sp. BrNp1-15]ULC58305.1 ATP-binding protein [Flaviramulus sp. BrNp1-15]
MYNQEYLENLIKDKKEENLNLEYKASKSLDRLDQKKLNEISKDVSAFANSNGGILIYGISEKEHLPEGIDPIQRGEVDREWLEQKIQDGIRPKIDEVKIYPIEINSNPSKVVYLIEIPQSTTAHQASDKRYYRRHNFNVLPMYDHEIRDVFNRIKTPKINLFFKVLVRVQNMGDTFGPGIRTEKLMVTTEYIFQVYAQNVGKVYANYINCIVQIPKSILLDTFEYDDSLEVVEFVIDNKVRDTIGLESNPPNYIEKLGPSRYEPILPSRTLRIDDNKCQLLSNYRGYRNKEINWVVYADNSEPISGRIKIDKIIEEYEYL